MYLVIIRKKDKFCYKKVQNLEIYVGRRSKKLTNNFMNFKIIQSIALLNSSINKSLLNLYEFRTFKIDVVYHVVGKLDVTARSNESETIRFHFTKRI